MAQQTEAQAFEALAKFLNDDEFDSTRWRINLWRDAHLIIHVDAKRGTPMFMVLNGRVEAMNLAHVTPDLTYVLLAGA